MNPLSVETMARKPKRPACIPTKTTLENQSFVMGRCHIDGISASEYVHRLITADRLKNEHDFNVMASALGFQVNRVNKGN